jgi:TonB family protein
MVRPKIPPDAKNIFGFVSVQAEIDKTGKPSSVKILSGHPILAAAVLDAVRQWRWKPLKLNGVGVETETTITVKFEQNSCLYQRNQPLCEAKTQARMANRTTMAAIVIGLLGR